MIEPTRVNQFELRQVEAGGPELLAAQALRYEVFYEEMGARPTPAMRAARRDSDRYDAVADHLVVLDLDRSAPGRPGVVGCYRIIRESVAAGAGGFYTANEFDLSGVRSPYGEFMELGRSCVHADYRSGAVMQLLWRGIADYLEAYGVGLMLGCASLPGTDPKALAPLLCYLHYNHLAPREIRPRALPQRYVATDRLARDEVNDREALRQLPPLLKGYLRLGGMIGEGAVIDEQFNTTDVCLVLPTATVQARAQRLFRHLAAVPAAA
jgi:L-ornithine Nalpha-acyltransferase